MDFNRILCHSTAKVGWAGYQGPALEYPLSLNPFWNKRVVKRYSTIFIVLLLCSAVFYQLFKKKTIKEVVVVKVSRGTISEEVTATGRVESVKETIIRTKLEGMIKSVFVDEGDKVLKGDLLAVYDSDFYENNFKKAKLALREAELRLAEGRKQSNASERIKFDPLEYGLSLKKSETEHETALINFRRSKRDYDNFRDLFKSKIVSKRDLDSSADTFEKSEVILKQAEKSLEDAKNLFSRRERTDLNIHSMETAERELELGLESAEVDVNYWRSQIEKLKVIAPHKGVVINKQTENGMLLNAGMEIVTVADVENLRILTEVDEIDAGRISIKMAATVTFEAFPGEIFEAEVVDISPRAVKKSERTIVEIKLKLLKPNFKLKINNQVNAKIVLQTREDILLTPLESLVEEGGSYFVWTGKNGKLATSPLRTGVSNFSMIEVMEGLKEGDPVVLRPGKNFLINEQVKLLFRE